MKSAPVVLMTALCLALTGCFGSMHEQMEHNGMDASYSQGYEEGVSSGKNAAGGLGYTLKKDTRRFANDEQYRQGWTDGYDAGKTQQRDWQKRIQPGNHK